MNHYNKPSFVIMALNKGPILDKLYLKEHGITSYKPLEGTWNGVKEESYLIPFHDDRGLQRLLTIAGRHNQSAVLVCNEDRDAFYYYGNNFRLIVPMGKLIEVSKDRAIKEACYSFDPETNQYFLIAE